MKMRCLECPLWLPKTEYSGLCLYRGDEKYAGSTCKLMEPYKGKIVRGVAVIPDDMDYTTRNRVLKCLEEFYSNRKSGGAIRAILGVIQRR